MNFKLWAVACLFVVLGVIGCANKDQPVLTPPIQGEVEPGMNLWALNCYIDLEPNTQTAIGDLGFVVATDIPVKNVDGRGPVNAVYIPGYYPKANEINWEWQNCPGKSFGPWQDVSKPGLAGYGTNICRLGFQQNTNQPGKYNECVQGVIEQVYN